MYVPRPFHYVFPAMLIAFPYALNRLAFGGGLSSDGLFWMVNYGFLQVGIEWARHISQGGVAYQKWEMGTPPEPQPITNWHTGKPVEDPIPVKVGGVEVGQIYSQTLQPVAMDYERNFARVLITQRNSNLKVNMTESFWIKENRFGESRETFVMMLDKWEYHGLSGREGGQAKRVIKDWKKVRMVEQGLKLPPPPRRMS